MASLHVTHENCFSPLHGSCLWLNDRQGWAVFMWPNPVSFSRGRRGGRSFMTQDNLKPQLGTYPSSPPPPPPLYFNFRRKESPGLFLWSCLHTSRLCKESRQPSSSGPLTDERCVCTVITIRKVGPSCFLPTQKPYCTIFLSEIFFRTPLQSGYNFKSAEKWDHTKKKKSNWLKICLEAVLSTCEASVRADFGKTVENADLTWRNKLKLIGARLFG